jgi:hypothetical protein
MLEASRAAILARLHPEDTVLDVGGGADPLPRADWVIDLMAYGDRGLYGGTPDPSRERFSAETWVQRDICERRPWPFPANHFAFAVCSHTLEDVRDPLWVCEELSRVARAGYIEVPSRLEEQSFGFQGPWVGWGHHRWLIDSDSAGLRFVFKHHVLHNRPAQHFPAGFAATLTPAERVLCLWWENSIPAREEIFTDGPALDAYLESFVREHGRPVSAPAGRRFSVSPQARGGAQARGGSRR